MTSAQNISFYEAFYFTNEREATFYFSDNRFLLGNRRTRNWKAATKL